MTLDPAPTQQREPAAEGVCGIPTKSYGGGLWHCGACEVGGQLPPPPPGVVVVVVVVGGIVVVVVVVGVVVVVVGGVVVVVVVVVVGGRVVVVTGGRVVVVESSLGGMVEDPSSVASLSAMLSPSSPPIVVEVEDVAGLVVDRPCSPSTSTPVEDPRLSTRVDSEVPAVEPNTATTTAARTPMASKVRKMPLAASFMGSPAIGTFLTHSPCGTLASRFVSDHEPMNPGRPPLGRPSPISTSGGSS